MRLATATFALLLPAATSAASLPTSDLMTLIERCASDVHPDTMLAVVKQESGGNPAAININRRSGQNPKPDTVAAAAALATKLIADDHNIDMGLGQVNSAHLTRLKLTPAQVFEPCTNLRVASSILVENYAMEQGKAPSAQAALDAALSRYSTGHPLKGVTNGYVRRVRAKAHAVPSLVAPEPADTATAPVAESAQTPTPQPAWDVYGSARYAREPDPSF